MRTKRISRSGFTMIELLFVIVILGIVGGLAIEAIRQYYNGIFRTNLYSQRAAEADHVLDQISKYFEYGIAASVVRLDKNSAPNGTTCDGPPQDDSLNDEYTFAFIAVDHEGLLGFWDGNLSRWRPTWTSNVEVNTAGITALDANYTQANSQEALTNAAIYDFGSSSAANVGVCNDFRWTSSPSTRYNTINAYTDTTLTLQNTPSESTDNKYLLRTGYAFRAYNGDFKMYTNFQPWNGENYTTNNGQILAKNVAHFTVDYDVTNTQMNSTKGNVYRLKLCMFGVDENLTEANTTATNKFQICRERMVHVRY